VRLPQNLKVEPLGRSHNREAFSCGVEALDLYLQHRARQDSDRNLAKVFVLTDDGIHIAAFYTLSAQAVQPRNLPAAMAAKLPRLPLPATLLGRLAVDKANRGKGVGEIILLHALQSAWQASQTVASWALVVDSKEGARDFYLKYGFVPFEDLPHRLYITMKDIEKLLR
jgi:predicted GNAT family N-acyltransferase